MGIARSFLAILISIQLSSAATSLEDGDIIFQDSQSSQSTAIKSATRSPYSHVGIILHNKGEPFVIEAVQPVSATPLKNWVQRGKGGHYVVKRLKDSRQFDAEAKSKLFVETRRFLGRNYDWQFDWSDKKIYCSELVWKVYARSAGIELCELKTLGDFDLSHPIVKQKLHERYGTNVPLSEPVVAPSDIFQSPLLKTVQQKKTNP